MATGLSLLGRGGTRRIIPVWVLHVAAAALAGAAFGGLLGWIGSLAGLGAWRPGIVGAAAVVALSLALRPGPLQFGRQRQVRRRWAPGTSAARIYLTWGALMGWGIATPIYHAAIFVLLAAQLGAGPVLGAASGAAFGAARQAVILYPALRRFDADRTMGLLETLRPHAWRFNLGLVAASGLILMLTSRR